MNQTYHYVCPTSYTSISTNQIMNISPHLQMSYTYMNMSYFWLHIGNQRAKLFRTSENMSPWFIRMRLIIGYSNILFISARVTYIMLYRIRSGLASLNGIRPYSWWFHLLRCAHISTYSHCYAEQHAYWLIWYSFFVSFWCWRKWMVRKIIMHHWNSDLNS